MLATAWSTGPPGAICTMKKFTVMIAQRVGIMRRRRRRTYLAMLASTCWAAWLLCPCRSTRNRGRGAYLGLTVRPRELVPVGDAELAQVPHRHDVVVPGQDPVEGPPPGEEGLLVRLVGDDAVDQVVDRRVLNSGHIVGRVDIVGAPDLLEVEVRVGVGVVAAIDHVVVAGLRMRLVYWVVSTWRMVIVTPMRSRFFWMGAATLAIEGL